jgi:linoleate 10R-lipoxygenase
VLFRFRNTWVILGLTGLLLPNTVYNDLPHPPATYIGPKYQWRTADGSFNNPDIPDLGKANTPYSRSVQQAHPLPASALPDAGLIFDTLLRRGEVRVSVEGSMRV